MPGKKKATGMSKRQSFLDRNIIAENKAIMRFNEALADEARGVERSQAPGREEGRRPRAAGLTGHARPARPVRPARPTLPPEEQEALRTAVSSATDDPGVAAAGAKLVDSLARGDRFERATEAGWRLLAADPVGGDRSARDWDRLRSAWSDVRRAALAEWVKAHPDAAALQEKEAKATAQAERVAARRARTPRSLRSQRPAARTAETAETAEAASEQPGSEADGEQASAAPAEAGRRRPRGRRRGRRATDPGSRAAAASADGRASRAGRVATSVGSSRPLTVVEVGTETGRPGASTEAAATLLRPPVLIRFRPGT